jgi:rRNA-processing protein FCF1
MLPRLQQAAKYDKQLVDNLSRLIMDADNAAPTRDGYVKFANNVAYSLQFTVGDTDLEMLLHNYRSSAIRTGQDGEREANESAGLEIQALKGRLTTIRDDVAREVDLWGVPCDVLVALDTNVLIHATKGEIACVDWHELLGIAPHGHVVLVLFASVLDELEKLKRDHKTKKAARRSFVQIREIAPQPGHRYQLPPVADQTTVELLVVIDAMDHIAHQVTDQEIIARTKSLNERANASQIRLATGDESMAYRAAAHGVHVTRVNSSDPE